MGKTFMRGVMCSLAAWAIVGVTGPVFASDSLEAEVAAQRAHFDLTAETGQIGRGGAVDASGTRQSGAAQSSLFKFAGLRQKPSGQPPSPGAAPDEPTQGEKRLGAVLGWGSIAVPFTAAYIAAMLTLGSGIAFLGSMVVAGISVGIATYKQSTKPTKGQRLGDAVADGAYAAMLGPLAMGALALDVGAKKFGPKIAQWIHGLRK